jgi:hypothetical protein
MGKFEGKTEVEQSEKYALFDHFHLKQKLFRFQNPDAKTFLMRNQSILSLTILKVTNSRKKQLQTYRKKADSTRNQRPKIDLYVGSSDFHGIHRQKDANKNKSLNPTLAFIGWWRPDSL